MIDIKKTYKNYVDGKYVRSESGKTYTKELKNEFYNKISSNFILHVYVIKLI